MSFSYQLITGILMLAGSMFILLAAVGLIRFPDTLMRMAAVSKAATLGLLLVLASASIGKFSQNDSDGVLMITFMIIFVFLTGPVASHLIGRAAYRSGATLFKNTQRDDWSHALTPSRHEYKNLNQKETNL